MDLHFEISRSSTPRQAGRALLALLLPAASSAGLLDPRPIGKEFCPLSDAVHFDGDQHVVAGLGDPDHTWVLAYRKFGSTRLWARPFDGEGLPAAAELDS